MNKMIYDKPQFVEGLTFRVDPSKVQEYMDTEERIWLEGLKNTPGFLGGEVWVSVDKPGEVTTFYFWESEEAYRSIDPVWLEAKKKESHDAMDAEFVRCWHAEERRIRVKEYR